MILLLCRYKRLTIFSFIVVFLWFLPEKTRAQSTVIENIVEEIANDLNLEDADYSTLIENLNFYAENPLNLNNADIEKLEKLHFLTEFQIENLLNYIALRNGMTTIYELQLIEGFNMEVIKKMLPFVTVSKKIEKEKLKVGKVLKYGKNKLIAETSFLLEDQKGYKSVQAEDETEATSSYIGDKFKHKLKYKFHYKDRLFAGLTAEKDPGEAFDFNKKVNGFDFYSAHFQLNDIGLIKRINLGDFQAKFGQGLILWTGFGMGKSADVLNIRKKGQGLRYYTSTDENNFLRGAGSTLKLGKLELTAFFSHKNIDANLEQTDTTENNESLLISLQNSGYHRTQTDLVNRKAVEETILGTRLGLTIKNLKLAVNFVGYKYGLTIAPSDKPYKYYDFSGTDNYNGSMDYQFFYKKFSLFGEAAMSKNGAFAVQNGLTASIVPQISFSLLQRYYQKDYQAHYSNSFAENSLISNEQGMYYGLEFYPFGSLKIAAYADLYEFPWLKYRVNAPSNGKEYFIQASYSINRWISMYFRWRSETKKSNLTVEDQPLQLISDEKKENYRYHISYQVSDLVQLRSRIEITHYQQSENSEYGYMFYQDANFNLKHIPLSFYIRYAVFDASYNARIYAYENDVLYGFSIPAYSGKGNRIYTMIKYSPMAFIDLRVRYSHFFFPGADKISSGLSEINGNKKSELKIQLVVKF